MLSEHTTTKPDAVLAAACDLTAPAERRMARVEEGHKSAEKGDAIEKDPKAAGDAAAPNTTPGPNGRVCYIPCSFVSQEAGGPVTIGCLCLCLPGGCAQGPCYPSQSLLCLFSMCSWMQAAPTTAVHSTLSDYGGA